MSLYILCLKNKKVLKLKLKSNLYSTIKSEDSEVLLNLINKCSAAAQIGDRLATIDMGRK